MKLKLIIDASVIFSLLLGSKRVRKILDSDAVELLAPEYLFDEIDEHKDRIKKLSKLSSKNIEELIELLKSKVKTVPKEEFDMFLTKSNELMSDKEDTEYLALSLSKQSTPIWSEDSHFKKQLIVDIFTTSELTKRLKED